MSNSTVQIRLRRRDYLGLPARRCGRVGAGRRRSARYIFGDSLGDPDGDAVVAALRAHPDGMTRVEISNLSSRNKDRAQLDRILGKLVGLGLAPATREMTGGRPAERWWHSDEINE